MQLPANKESRPSRKGRTDNYMEARNAIEQRSKLPNSSEHMWLEVIEGSQSNAVDYVIHASDDATQVPPFAIEVYQRGVLQSYEVRHEEILQRAVMPEELRQRVVLAQKALASVEHLGVAQPSSSLVAA